MTTHLAELRSLIGRRGLTARQVAAVEEAIRLADGVRHMRQACRSDGCGEWCAAWRACKAVGEMEREREE